MNSWLLLIAVLIPILFGVTVGVIRFREERTLEIYTEVITIVTAVLVFLLLLNRPDELVIFHFTENLIFSFRLDGLGTVFAGLVSILWPIASLYMFEYMSHAERKQPFYMFYTMTFGVTLGIAFAGNILTMYIFYEMLTLITIPLVIHTFSKEAVLATRKYILFSMSGAAMGFIGMVYILQHGGGGNFTLGGILSPESIPNKEIMLVLYFIAFMGFSVKAAMFPFYSWLPDAGVAPTPVTALLHAVAVVKAGAFSVMRLTYYCYGTDLVHGTWAQILLMGLAMFTIVFGCSMALKETHLKRRLAYSTVSNLSYIIFGVTLMTPEGLYGGLCHMAFHAIMKITAFYCAGAIIHQTGAQYINETNGFGRKMPWVYTAFTVSALGLMGMPGGCGFISKWYLAQGIIASEIVPEWLGVGCLLVSALLTAIYMMSIVIRGVFPERDFDMNAVADVEDPGWKMVVPLAVLSIAIVVFGVHSEPLTNLLYNVATGVF